MTRPDDEIDRFFEQVTYGPEFADAGRCLLWNGAQGGNGKGPTFGVDGKRVDPLEYAYALEHGEEFIKGDATVINRCDSKMCVNFQHLIAVKMKTRPRV